MHSLPLTFGVRLGDIHDAHGHLAVHVAPVGTAQHRADLADLIVRAVNCHEELVQALDGLLNALPSATTHPAIAAARAALSKARGLQEKQK